MPDPGFAENVVQVVVVCCSCDLVDRDWEDIKKMPEHQTLMKDFKKVKLASFVFPFASALQVQQENPTNCGTKAADVRTNFLIGKL